MQQMKQDSSKIFKIVKTDEIKEKMKLKLSSNVQSPVIFPKNYNNEKNKKENKENSINICEESITDSDNKMSNCKQFNPFKKDNKLNSSKRASFV